MLPKFKKGKVEFKEDDNIVTVLHDGDMIISFNNKGSLNLRCGRKAHDYTTNQLLRMVAYARKAMR